MAALKFQSTSAQRLDALFAAVRLVACPSDIRDAVARLRTQIDKGMLSRYRRGERLPSAPTRVLLADATKTLAEPYRVEVAGWDDAAA